MANSTSGFLRRKEELLEFLGGIDYDARCAALMSAVKKGEARSAVSELKEVEGRINDMLEQRVQIPYLDNKIDVYVAKFGSLKQKFWQGVNDELSGRKSSFDKLYNLARRGSDLQKCIAALRKLSETAVVLEDLVGQNTPLIRSYAEYSSSLKGVDQLLEQLREAYINEQIAPEEVIKKVGELEVSYEKVNSAHQPNVLFKHPAYKYSNSLLTRLKREAALHKRRNFTGIKTKIRNDVLEMTGILQNLHISGEEYFGVLQRVQNLPVSKDKYKRWKKFSFLAKDVASYKAAFEDYSGTLEKHARQAIDSVNEPPILISNIEGAVEYALDAVRKLSAIGKCTNDQELLRKSERKRLAYTEIVAAYVEGPRDELSRHIKRMKGSIESLDYETIQACAKLDTRDPKSNPFASELVKEYNSLVWHCRGLALKSPADSVHDEKYGFFA